MCFWILSVKSTPLIICKWRHHKKSRLSKNTSLIPYGTGGERVDRKTNTPCRRTQETQSKDEGDPAKHFNSTDAERSKTNFQRQREEMFQYRTDEDRSNRPAADQTTTGKDFTQGSEAVSPRQDTWIRHTHTFSFLPPPFVSSQGFQLN